MSVQQIISFILLLPIGFVCPVLGQQTVTELDPTVSATIEVTKKVRFEIYAGREKSEEIESSKKKVGTGISIRLKPVFRRFLDAVDTDKQHVLVFGTTYEYSVANERAVKSIEHKLMFDVSLRYAFPSDLLFSNRNRAELRRVNGNNHFRFRNRPMLERPFRVRQKDYTPYVAAEAYWDQRYGKWNMFKISGGIVVPLARRFSMEFLYERQHCVTCADPNTNILGISLNISIKPKKR